MKWSQALGRILSRILLASSVLCMTLAANAQPDDDRLTRIKNSNELRVCIWPDYFSISARHPKTGELEGIDIDLARAFAEDLDVRLTFVDTSFGRFMDDLHADRCDIGMFAIAITEARSKRIDYSEPYLASHMYGVTTRTATAIQRWQDIDQPGAVVCVQKGTYMEGQMRRSLKYADLLVVTHPREREQAVMSGQADIFITDYPYSRKVLRFYDWARVIEPEDLQAERPFRYAYAIAKGQPAWQQRVNDFVHAIKRDGRLQRAAARHDLTPAVVNAVQDN